VRKQDQSSLFIDQRIADAQHGLHQALDLVALRALAQETGAQG
jgi:hypothetical protein